MSLEQAITDITNRIMTVSPEAVIRVLRQSDEEATIRAYAQANHEEAIKNATREITFELLTKENLDVQVIFYDIATSLPPEE
jgi:DNA-binding protein H-NS